MAEAYVKAYGCSLELDVSEFALVFALFNDLLKKENSGLLTPGITELKDVIRKQNLDHDWHQVFHLDTFLRDEADHSAFQELVARSILRIRQVGWELGVPKTFYESFEGASFAPAFPDGTNWRAVAWPFIQVAMVPMLRDRLGNSWPLLKALGW